MSAPEDLAPYAELLSLTERERELVLDRRFDALEALADERARLVETLPARPPLAARALLERSADLQADTTRLLTTARDGVADELRTLGRGRAVARAYGPAGHPAEPHRLDRAG